MNKILKQIGVAGHTASSPETSPQHAAKSQPSATTRQRGSVPHNTAMIVEKYVIKAQREFETQTVKLIEAEGRGFYLRLAVTLAYIWLKIGDKDAYVDEILKTLREKYQDAWVPSKSTLQHYEGPMLRWLADLARQKDPNDPNLREKFTPVFLGKHPQYVVNVGKAQLEELCHECKTLVGLDKKYGNGCLKTVGTKAELCAEGIKRMEPAVKTESAGATTEPSQESMSAGAAEAESAINPSVQSNPTQPVPDVSQTQVKRRALTPNGLRAESRGNNRATLHPQQRKRRHE